MTRRNQLSTVPAPPRAVTAAMLDSILDDPRYAGTAEEKRRFVEALAATGTIKAACLAIGIGRMTCWRWRDEDPAFANVVESILRATQEDKLDQIETVLDDLAINEGQVLPLFFRAKRLDSRYKDNYRPTPPGQTQQAIADDAALCLDAWQDMLSALGLDDMTHDLPQLPEMAGHMNDDEDAINTAPQT